MAKKLTSNKAKEILHDKSVHGKPLTEKQRKFFGAIAGGAKPYKAQNGIEGTMGGLTDVGFNYNGAWGGQWAMGGSLPGATGMMYARTVNAAPANGPYAKKTKASAQNGKEMAYYQQGLDFKPKMISQDGAIIDPMGQWAHPGQITRIPSNNITMKGVDYPVVGVSDTGQTKMMYPDRDYTFDGTYVTEYPMAEDGVSVNMADEGSLKKLDQLTNFTNYNNMAKAKQGKKLKKAQYGIGDYMKSVAPQGTMANYNMQTGMVNSPNATVSKADTTALGLTGENLKSPSMNFGDVAGSAGMGMLQGLPQIIGGVEQIIEQGKQKKQQKQLSQITGLALQANTKKQIQPHQYVRPEDTLLTSEEMGVKPYGTGTSFLEDGGSVIRNRIGGNPTEIQNTYNPGNVYSDLGYEPLRETDVKQFQQGGGVKFGDFFQSSGQAQIGSAVGSAIGNALLPGVGGAIGNLVGTVGGNLLGGAKNAAEMRKIQNQNALNQQQAAYTSAMQGQFSSFMEDGGDVSPYKWVSHTWQPQVITQFGEHKVKDLLTPPKDADMLRTGGEIRKNYYFDTDAFPHSKDGSSTMGGDLQIIDGGKAETMSYNPFLPDGGETVMFRGRSHDNGGIPISYGENGVEVEGGEPAVKLEDGGTDKSLVVFGNMKISKQAANLMEDPKAKGQKFKNYIADVAKNEAKQNKIIDKSTELVRSANTNNPFDQLTMNAGMANITGALMKQRMNAMKKMNAAAVQSAILDTAEQLGKDSDQLNEQVMDNMAAFGGKFSKAQYGSGVNPYASALEIGTQPPGIVPTGTSILAKSLPTAVPTSTTVGTKKKSPYKPSAADITKEIDAFYQKPHFSFAPIESTSKLPKHENVFDAIKGPTNLEEAPVYSEVIKNLPELKKTPKEGWKDWVNLGLSQAAPFLRPSNVKPLDPQQIYPELMALAMNQQEPVQAQKFTPMFQQPVSISLQDQINAVDSQSRAAIRAAGYNPAAQAQIAANAAEAKTKILGEQTRINMGQMAQTAAQNRQLANQAQLQNLQLLDQQYVRQAQAKSATKAQAVEVAKSIAAKTLQNKLENQRLAVMENMYNYRFSPSGRAYSVNAPYQFNIPTAGTIAKGVGAGLAPGYEFTYDQNRNIIGTRKSKDSEGRNGSIVKAIKGL